MRHWSVYRGIEAKDAALARMLRTGLTPSGIALWSSEEDEILRATYPDLAAAGAKLLRRTTRGISGRARKLGLSRSRRVWTSDETRRFPPLYKSDAPISAVIEQFPGKTKRQAWSKGSNLRIRRPRRQLKPTGFTIVDLIRARAFGLGYTMTDLDEWTGFKRYWRGPRHVNWLAIDRALRLLGGIVMPVWPD